MYLLLSVYCVFFVPSVSVSRFLQDANLISGIRALVGASWPFVRHASAMAVPCVAHR